MYFTLVLSLNLTSTVNLSLKSLDWKLDPGSTKMFIQEHVVLCEITFTAFRTCIDLHKIDFSNNQILGVSYYFNGRSNMKSIETNIKERVIKM